jgi:hypothetical protein
MDSYAAAVAISIIVYAFPLYEATTLTIGKVHPLWWNQYKTV